MPAYIIGIRRTPVRDENAMSAYQQRTRALQSEIKLIPRVVYGALDPLEGEAPEGVVMMEFEDMEAARKWYADPAYQAAVPFRQQAADYDLFIVDGLNR